MVSMMKDVVQRGTAAGSVGSQFHLPAGGKTGTTNDGTDAWFIGYTSDLVAGLWVGFDKPQTIKRNAQGGHIAAPAWTAFMNEVYRRKPAPPDWPRPEGIVVREIDPATGLLRSRHRVLHRRHRSRPAVHAELWRTGCGLRYAHRATISGPVPCALVRHAVVSHTPPARHHHAPPATLHADGHGAPAFTFISA